MTDAVKKKGPNYDQTLYSHLSNEHLFPSTTGMRFTVNSRDGLCEGADVFIVMTQYGEATPRAIIPVYGISDPLLLNLDDPTVLEVMWKERERFMRERTSAAIRMYSPLVQQVDVLIGELDQEASIMGNAEVDDLAPTDITTAYLRLSVKLKTLSKYIKTHREICDNSSIHKSPSDK